MTTGLIVRVQYGVSRKGIPAPGLLHRAARSAWRAQSTAEVSIRVVDAEEGAELNFRFRHRNGPTNVLSFPGDEDPDERMDIPYLGDLVLCAPVLFREAVEQRKTLSAHYAHMVVHGMLHLQGFTHQADAEAEMMEKLEQQILKGLGYADPYQETDEVPD